MAPRLVQVEPGDVVVFANTGVPLPDGLITAWEHFLPDNLLVIFTGPADLSVIRKAASGGDDAVAGA